MHGRLTAAGCWLAIAGAVALAAPATAAAETYTVTSQEDSPEATCEGQSCQSIRAALGVAGDGDSIRIPAGVYRLALGPLEVAEDVTIVGAGAAETAVRGPIQARMQAREGRIPRVFQIGNFNLRPSVEISHLTIADGSVSCGNGGNVLNYGRLRLHHVHVTNGWASSGGGIANFDGSLVVDKSLIEGNSAGGCEGAGGGGGIFSEAAAPDALVVRDSTITDNYAGFGGGVAVADYSEVDQPLSARIERVTLARNGAYIGSGGLHAEPGTRVHVTGSIIAENTALESEEPSNCGTTPVDGGGNLAFPDDCDFGAEADPQLSQELVEGLGETALLTIPPGSPAVDRAGACEGVDQRDLVRPQGDACDAGAYEVVAPAIETGPAGTASERSATFTFSGEPGSEFECRLDGPAGAGPWEPCASPKTYNALADGSYTFYVRVAGTTAQATRAFAVATPAPSPPPPPPAAPPALPAQTPTPVPVPTPTPEPEYRRSVVAKPTSGTVRVRLPGTRRYVDLATLDRLPMGAILDAREGRVRLYAARSASGRVQAASFSGGVFRVVQRGSYVELQLRGPKPTCASRGSASSAAKKARKRRLWGSGRGRFRTRGRYSAATVRGTKWLVEDRCGSTLTRVVRGVVTVRDFKRHRTIRLRAGDRYIARRR
jgi:hypothetical protein